jgi:hypothetical protein
MQEVATHHQMPWHAQADMLRAYENEKRILEAEISGYKANSAKHDKTLQVWLLGTCSHLHACCAKMSRQSCQTIHHEHAAILPLVYACCRCLSGIGS